jgi:pyruvate dehydrogenase E2 component (dihydrolipoamide acetyltransferase)
MSSSIHALTMPKWGLTMEQGTVAAWNKAVGDPVGEGEEVCDVETEKIAGGMESPASGILRRQVAAVGDELPIGALLGVLADESVSDEEIDAFVAAFQEAPPAAGDEAGAVEEALPETIDVAGRRIRHLLQKGDGVPVVLVHGFGGNLENWVLNHAALAATGRTVAALDLPGHGESIKTVESGSLEELATAVLAYMDAMDFGEAHLVGHSMGSAVCLTVQRLAPGRVKSLALIAPAGLGQAVNAEYIAAFTESQTRRQLKPVLLQLFADEGFVTRQLVDDTLKYKRLEGMTEALRSIAGQSLGGAGVSLPALAAELPVLVIWGSRDQVITAADAGQWRETDVEYHLVADRGHMVQVEAADEVNRLLTGFLERQA